MWEGARCSGAMDINCEVREDSQVLLGRAGAAVTPPPAPCPPHCGDPSGSPQSLWVLAEWKGLSLLYL